MSVCYIKSNEYIMSYLLQPAVPATGGSDTSELVAQTKADTGLCHVRALVFRLNLSSCRVHTTHPWSAQHTLGPGPGAGSLHPHQPQSPHSLWGDETRG